MSRAETTMRALLMAAMAAVIGYAPLCATAAPRPVARVTKKIAKKVVKKVVARPGPTKRPAQVVAAAPVSREIESPPPDAADPDRARVMRLQQALTSIAHGPVLGRLRVGMRVLDSRSGRTFFRRRDDVLMDPASNQKVLATATALLLLGHDYQFRTQVEGPLPDADGVLRGDVVLRGSGDPSLRADDLNELVSGLVARGVQRLEGGVRADDRRVGLEERPAGPAEPSHDERSTLHLLRGAVVVRVRPGDHEGAPPLVSVSPSPEAFQIVNRAQTRGKGKNRVAVTVSAAQGRMVVTVSGRISLTHPGQVIRRAPPNPRLYAAALLNAALHTAGIEVRDPPSLLMGGRPPVSGSQALAVHVSAPLSLLIRHLNKDSDNEYADRLLAVVGAETYGGAATNAKGLRALREAMNHLGIAATGYRSANGSGLGHMNRISAATMADLLWRLYQDPRIGPEILQSLSVGGVDGTTRNRFRGGPAAERVRAKTGTLRGKSCLSGYVGDGGDVLVFSIFVEGLRGRRLGTQAARAAQVMAVNAMMRFSRGAVGELPGDEVLPPDDLEAGDDLPDTDEDEPTDPETAVQPDTASVVP